MPEPTSVSRLSLLPFRPEAPDDVRIICFFVADRQIEAELGWLPLLGTEWCVFKKSPGYADDDVTFVCSCRSKEDASMIAGSLNVTEAIA